MGFVAGTLTHGARPLRVFFGVPDMDVTRKRRLGLHPVTAQLLLGIVGVALLTFVCFQVDFGIGKTGSAYVILIAPVSLLGSFSVSFFLSILCVACLNYFFVPPLFEFRVDDPEDVTRIAVFLTTSLVVTGVTAKLRASEGRFRAFVDNATDAFRFSPQNRAAWE